ncbi:MAG: helix-hairpin-helix domain-containing protein [Planctomycetes bacterium]|nr:helix-hairpin-helix domain-containing protein [Planctomycetota bacterium]
MAAETGGRLSHGERRSFLVGAIAVLCAGVLLAQLHVCSVDRQYCAPGAPGVRVNVNTADLEALALLYQIGPERARRIIEYREAHGPFRSFPDLLRVEGIGVKTVEGLVGQVCFSE